MSALRIADVRRWMFDEALPFWSTAGLDPCGFVEQVALDGSPAPAGFKRMRVQARQIYVYSHAHLMGWSGPAKETATRGLSFVIEYGWLDEGGWAKVLGEHGGVLDPTVDLYDQAFVILALAWYYRAFAERDALRWAERSVDVVRTRLGRADGRGFWPKLPPGGEELQNPHMHSLEAMLAMCEATGDVGYSAAASAIATLMAGTFYDKRTQTLAEYFDADWNRQPAPRGRIVEPGHHLEWVWLLHHCGRLTGARFDGVADGLYAFARRHGASAHSELIYDALLDDGSVHDRRHRCWPQTEALKAHLAMAEFASRVDRAAIAGVVANLLDRYLAARPAGIWIDQFDDDGAPLAKTVPASTLYHVYLAFSELLRLAPKLGD
jgi:mannose/cellobiose epimerase-like protein (N-acyl-D-glucosamine 2-epimerase family)